jgi:glucokinase
VKALAVDLGGSHAACALVDDDRLVAASTVDTDGSRGLSGALPAIAGALRTLLASSGVDASACGGIAFGFCGLVDTTAHRVLSTNAKYDDAPALDLVAWARDALGLGLRLENDARLALLGERHAGAARGFDDVVMMTLGTGVGGAAMMEGRLVRGRHFQAGCLGGHLPARFDGLPCSCGAIGCVEAEASTAALPRLLAAWPGATGSTLATASPLDYRAVLAAARAGDAVATGIRDRSLQVWAAGAVGLVHAYDPEVVVVGGGVLAGGDEVLAAIADRVHHHAWTPWGRVTVRASALGASAALLGAVPLLSMQDA